MNPRNLARMAEEMKALREQVDRIRYTHHGVQCAANMRTGEAALRLVNRLRFLEDAYRKAASEQPVVADVVVEAAKPIPQDLPAPKRKPGRPRKNPVPPAEAEGIA